MERISQAEINRIIEFQDTMSVVQRIEGKIDDIRGKIHEIDIMSNGTQIKQLTQEAEIRSLKAEVASLKTAYDRASGGWKLLSIPGVLSFLYAVSQIFQK